MRSERVRRAAARAAVTASRKTGRPVHPDVAALAASDRCTCHMDGCGIDHPHDWQPQMTAHINGVVVVGDDHADCFAHYLLRAGYPTDRPQHLRKIAENMAARRAR